MNAAKLHQSLAAAMTVTQYDEQPIAIIVKVRRGPMARGEMRALAKQHPAHEFRFLDAQAMSATPSMISALSQDPAVELIWPDLPVHAWLDEAVPLIGAPRVWAAGFTGKGVKVAILDTGLDPDHPDFGDRVRDYRDFIDPPAEGATAVPKDPNGHGTHVAGIAAGSGAASDGRYRGVAPGASLVIGRVLDEVGNGRTSTVMAGIEWAIEQGARVINISLGGSPFPSDGTDALSTLVNAAVEHGVVVCVAAGNMGPGGHTIGAPSAAARAITVGASETDGRGGEQVAAFSSRGPTADGRVKPDLLFPGVGIVAPRAGGTALGEVVNDRYTALRGTSQATPMATGSVALMLEANPRLTPDAVKERLMRGAHLLPGTPAVDQGAGRGDAYDGFAGQPGDPLGAPGSTRPETVAHSGCLPAAATAFFIH